MANGIKKKTNEFIKKYSVGTVNYSALKNVAERLGYTVIEFGSVANDEDVDTVIRGLLLDDAVLASRGFTYVSKDYRLIFVNESLNDEEKTLVIAHELGHIICEHFTTAPIIGKDVREEHEANEFAHYLLKESLPQRIRLAFIRHARAVKLASAVLISLVVVVTAVMIINTERRAYGEYYITTSGNKYHERQCIHIKNNNNVERLTIEQFESGDFEPCGVCLP